MPTTPPAPSIEDARRSLYRSQVLAAAEAEFSRHGFAGTKMAAVAKAADLSLATVYKQFSGKEEIWDALHADRMAELLAHVEGSGSTGTPLERVVRGIGAVAEFLMAHPTYLDMNLWSTVGWASTPHRAATGVEASVWSSGQETIAAGIRAAVAAGEIPDVKPSVGVGMVVAILQVHLSAWVTDGRTQPPAEVVAALEERLRWVLAGPS
ncbi:MAG: TetR/AcrR family transcriptional regulator [Nocardioides sp.]|uniref:TetR/AcrR family transcriptional regulator n=1 Tax=Nocardioides sp. TaxID=35761 RepID=UPI003F0957D9